MHKYGTGSGPATGRSVDYEPRCSSRNSRIERFVYCTLGPVAITTPAGLPVWGPRSAPGSVFVDARSQTLCVDFKAKLIQNREPVGETQEYQCTRSPPSDG